MKISENKIKKVIELPKEGGPFVMVERKYFEELKDALRAVIEGENALRDGNIRSFKDFLNEEFPKYAKDK